MSARDIPSIKNLMVATGIIIDMAARRLKAVQETRQRLDVEARKVKRMTVPLAVGTEGPDGLDVADAHVCIGRVDVVEGVEVNGVAFLRGQSGCCGDAGEQWEEDGGELHVGGTSFG